MTLLSHILNLASVLRPASETDIESSASASPGTSSHDYKNGSPISTILENSGHLSYSSEEKTKGSKLLSIKKVPSSTTLHSKDAVFSSTSGSNSSPEIRERTIEFPPPALVRSEPISIGPGLKKKSSKPNFQKAFNKDHRLSPTLNLEHIYPDLPGKNQHVPNKSNVDQHLKEQFFDEKTCSKETVEPQAQDKNKAHPKDQVDAQNVILHPLIRDKNPAKQDDTLVKMENVLLAQKDPASSEPVERSPTPAPPPPPLSNDTKNLPTKTNKSTKKAATKNTPEPATSTGQLLAKTIPEPPKKPEAIKSEMSRPSSTHPISSPSTDNNDQNRYTDCQNYNSSVPQPMHIAYRLYDSSNIFQSVYTLPVFAQQHQEHKQREQREQKREPFNPILRCPKGITHWSESDLAEDYENKYKPMLSKEEAEAQIEADREKALAGLFEQEEEKVPVKSLIRWDPKITESKYEVKTRKPERFEIKSKGATPEDLEDAALELYIQRMRAGNEEKDQKDRTYFYKVRSNVMAVFGFLLQVPDYEETAAKVDKFVVQDQMDGSFLDLRMHSSMVFLRAFNAYAQGLEQEYDLIDKHSYDTEVQLQNKLNELHFQNIWSKPFMAAFKVVQNMLTFRPTDTSVRIQKLPLNENFFEVIFEVVQKTLFLNKEFLSRNLPKLSIKALDKSDHICKAIKNIKTQGLPLILLFSWPYDYSSNCKSAEQRIPVGNKQYYYVPVKMQYFNTKDQIFEEIDQDNETHFKGTVYAMFKLVSKIF